MLLEWNYLIDYLSSCSQLFSFSLVFPSVLKYGSVSTTFLKSKWNKNNCLDVIRSHYLHLITAKLLETAVHMSSFSSLSLALQRHLFWLSSTTPLIPTSPWVPVTQAPYSRGSRTHCRLGLRVIFHMVGPGLLLLAHDSALSPWPPSPSPAVPHPPWPGGPLTVL